MYTTFPSALFVIYRIHGTTSVTKPWVSKEIFKINVAIYLKRYHLIYLQKHHIRIVVLRLAKDWKVQGSNPHPSDTGPLTIGTELFPGVKRSRRGANHQPPSTERVELYLYLLSGLL